jgi:hypothetical protein
MNLQSRSLPSAVFRPQPTVYQSEDGKTLAVITNWGDADATALVVDKVKSALSPILIDSEETRIAKGPAQKGAPIEIKLSEAVRAANNEIYKKENISAWKTVVEVTVLHVSNGIVFWAQAGTPHLLKASSSSTEFLSVSADSTPLSMPPLPTMGIGLDEFPNISSGSAPIQHGARLALISISGSALPALSQSPLSMEHILQSISAIQPNPPAWIGLIDFES